MKISKKGIDLIKEFESFSSTPYFCSSGKMTIGWGHKLLPSESYTLISLENAEFLLLQDLQVAIEYVSKKVEVVLTQNQFDALVSLVFNVGTGAFKNSYALKLLNKSQYKEASYEFFSEENGFVYFTNPKTNKVEKLQGLINRRAREQQIFNK